MSYGEKNYWDQRYEKQSDEKYDWYLDYLAIKDAMLSHCGGFLHLENADQSDVEASKLKEKKDCKVLVLGCGNSVVSEQMYDDGFTDIVSVDFSDIVIENMKKTTPAHKSLVFEVMDVRELKYPDASFDMLVDKGTLDALLCGEDSAKNADFMLAECSRVMTPGARLFVITYGTPEWRLTYLENPKYKWKVTTHFLSKDRFIYIMTKA